MYNIELSESDTVLPYYLYKNNKFLGRFKRKEDAEKYILECTSTENYHNDGD